MSGYNDSLDKSLGLLYDHSLNFKVSVGLVQKLAQYLKLDTFIDTEVRAGATSETKDLKRLSIAGSLLLLDLDFAGDDKPIKVSLSSGNHVASEGDTSRQLPNPAADTDNCIVSVEEKDQISVVKVDFSQGAGISFLNARHDNDHSVAEHILLSNLTSGTLGTFPANLKYLANLDSMSPQDGDLVVYLDNVALYLSAIHASEIKANPDNWEIEQGWKSRVGKVSLNDAADGRLGVILLFWKENRFLDRNEEGENSPVIHKAVLSIEEASLDPLDYLKEAVDDVWQLSDPQGTFKSYKFTFDGDLHLHNGQSVTSLISRNWTLLLNLASPVYISKTLLDFLGLTDYKIAKNAELSETFKQLGECGHLHYTMERSNLKVSFASEDLTQYLPIQSIRMDSLSLLSKILPILRNQLALTALIRNVSKAPDVVLLDAKAESAEASKKLKNTLKLASDVTDDELAGLSTMSEATDYMGVPILDGGADLKTFFKQESLDDMLREESGYSEISNSESGDSVTFLIKDILYDSPDTNVLLSVSGQVKSRQIQLDLEIKNGALAELKEPTEDVDMDAANEVNADFAKALALSEDPLLAFDVIN